MCTQKKNFPTTFHHLPIKGLIDNPMCPCDDGAQSSEHLTYDCKILEFQRNTLKHQTKSSGGTWPTTNSDLIAKYSHTLSRFIKSVDFNKPQYNI